MAVISRALLRASKAACESAMLAVGVAVGVLAHPAAVAASASAATRVAMPACEGVHAVVSLRFLVVDGENTKAATRGIARPVVAFGRMLSRDTDSVPVLPVFTARPIFCFARVTDDDPRAGVLHEVCLDVLSWRPTDALVEVAIGDGARP